MGYGVTAYAVDLDLVSSHLGSGDEDVLRHLKNDISPISADLEELIRDVVAEDPPDVTELIRHMVFGEPYDQRLGSAYGRIFEAVCDCEEYGHFLDNSAWYPVSLSFIDSVEAALGDAEVATEAFSVKALLFGGSPIPLPPIDDFPGIGHLPRTGIPPALRALPAIDLDRLPDRDVRGAIVASESGFRRAARMGSTWCASTTEVPARCG